ncbi:hypothetical protein MTO96_003217 [Rhipicephalus appendiculatus]
MECLAREPLPRHGAVRSVCAQQNIAGGLGATAACSDEESSLPANCEFAIVRQPEQTHDPLKLRIAARRVSKAEDSACMTSAAGAGSGSASGSAAVRLRIKQHKSRRRRRSRSPTDAGGLRQPRCSCMEKRKGKAADQDPSTCSYTSSSRKTSRQSGNTSTGDDKEGSSGEGQCPPVLSCSLSSQKRDKRVSSSKERKIVEEVVAVSPPRLRRRKRDGEEQAAAKSLPSQMRELRPSRMGRPPSNVSTRPLRSATLRTAARNGGKTECGDRELHQLVQKVHDSISTQFQDIMGTSSDYDMTVESEESSVQRKVAEQPLNMAEEEPGEMKKAPLPCSALLSQEDKDEASVSSGNADADISKTIEKPLPARRRGRPKLSTARKLTSVKAERPMLRHARRERHEDKHAGLDALQSSTGSDLSDLKPFPSNSVKKEDTVDRAKTSIENIPVKTSDIVETRKNRTTARKEGVDDSVDVDTLLRECNIEEQTHLLHMYQRKLKKKRFVQQPLRHNRCTSLRKSARLAATMTSESVDALVEALSSVFISKQASLHIANIDDIPAIFKPVKYLRPKRTSERPLRQISSASKAEVRKQEKEEPKTMPGKKAKAKKQPQPPSAMPESPPDILAPPSGDRCLPLKKRHCLLSEDKAQEAAKESVDILEKSQSKHALVVAGAADANKRNTSSPAEAMPSLPRCEMPVLTKAAKKAMYPIVSLEPLPQDMKVFRRKPGPKCRKQKSYQVGKRKPCNASNTTSSPVDDTIESCIQKFNETLNSAKLNEKSRSRSKSPVKQSHRCDSSHQVEPESKPVLLPESQDCESQDDLLLKPQSASQPDIQPDPQTQSQVQSQSASKTESKTESQTESDTASQTGTQIELQTEPQPESEPLSDSQSESHPEMQSQSNSQSQREPKLEFQTEELPETQPSSHPVDDDDDIPLSALEEFKTASEGEGKPKETNGCSADDKDKISSDTEIDEKLEENKELTSDNTHNMDSKPIIGVDCKLKPSANKEKSNSGSQPVCQETANSRGKDNEKTVEESQATKESSEIQQSQKKKQLRPASSKPCASAKPNDLESTKGDNIDDAPQEIPQESLPVDAPEEMQEESLPVDTIAEAIEAVVVAGTKRKVGRPVKAKTRARMLAAAKRKAKMLKGAPRNKKIKLKKPSASPITPASDSESSCTLPAAVSSSTAPGASLSTLSSAPPAGLCPVNSSGKPPKKKSKMDSTSTKAPASMSSEPPQDDTPVVTVTKPSTGDGTHRTRRRRRREHQLPKKKYLKAGLYSSCFKEDGSLSKDGVEVASTETSLPEQLSSLNLNAVLCWAPSPDGFHLTTTCTVPPRGNGGHHHQNRASL